MKFTTEYHENYTWIRLDDRSLIPNISTWCKEQECGKRVNRHTFSFKNEKEITLFLLRWQGAE